MATATPSLSCDPCKDCGEEQVPVALCLDCRELYCKTCLNCHIKTTATKSHSYVYVSGEESGEKCPCDLCDADNNIATSLCDDCRQLYCTTCTKRHRKLKATKNHVIMDIISYKSAAISSELAACSLDFDVTYSGAQVPVDKKDKPKQQDKDNQSDRQNQQDRKFVKKNKAAVLDNKICTSESEPLHSDDTARRSDVKQTSLSGTFHCTFSVRTPSDKKSIYINRMISMPDGRICVVVSGNNKIKLYTDDYVLCDEVCVPWCTAVTCVDEDTVAVATSYGDITRYSVKENKITQTGRTLHIDGVIRDIAYRRGEFITMYNKHNTDYTCCGSKVIVKQDRRLLLDDFIQYDPVSDCVILGNSRFDEEHTVTCYTLDGDIKWRVTLDSGPKGMVVVHGVVLVADYSNNTIRQITMDGRQLSTHLLTKDRDITDPHAIAYQHKQHRLLVTGFTDENVMVFNVTE